MILEGDLTPQQILEQVGGYHTFLPDDAIIEHEGKAVKLRDLPDIQNAKDLPTLAKNYVEAQREIGRRVRIPGKDATPEDRQAFKAKLYETGVLTVPPASPQDYAITKPEDLPDGLGWTDELATELATTLHRHGVPKEAAADLLALHTKALLGAQTALRTSLETGLSALKTEFGDQFDSRMELATRLVPTLFKSEEELEFLERTGLANHPGFLGLIMRLAPLAQQDSSFMAGLSSSTSGTMTGEHVRAEIAKIMSDTKHPDHAGYWKQDPAVMKKIEAMYQQAYGTATVTVS